MNSYLQQLNSNNSIMSFNFGTPQTHKKRKKKQRKGKRSEEIMREGRERETHSRLAGRQSDGK